MKKIMAVVIAFGLLGCGGGGSRSGDESKGAKAGEGGPATTEPDFKLSEREVESVYENLRKRTELNHFSDRSSLQRAIIVGAALEMSSRGLAKIDFESLSDNEVRGLWGKFFNEDFKLKLKGE